MTSSILRLLTQLDASGANPQDINLLAQEVRAPSDAADFEYITTDVFIAGSGPVGCTFARNILAKRSETRIFMSEVGSQVSPELGYHQKNDIGYQKDIDRFVHVIKGALSTTSIPPASTYVPTLAPSGSWAPRYEGQVRINGHNPRQDPFRNLGASAVTRTVGGMATHWTCATPTPRFDELPDTYKPEEWKSLYTRARAILKTNDTSYDHSIRHTVVKEALQKGYGVGREVASLPLALNLRRTDNSDFVTWTGSNTILGKLAEPGYKGNFTLRVSLTCFFFYDVSGGNVNQICGAYLRDLKDNKPIIVRAKIYVAACGAVLTPQLLYNSSIKPPALGRYLSEQSMSFCQIVLSRDIVEGIRNDPRWSGIIGPHCAFWEDPIPIPYNDPEPQVTLPYSQDTPWHVQVHRDAFSYGDVGPKVDPRLVVDLRFFGKTDVNRNNLVSFESGNPAFPGRPPWDTKDLKPGVSDIYGMPQPTFEFVHSDEDQRRNDRMMSDMCRAASFLGSYLPGSNPQFLEPGLALHITGTIRAGNDPETSVVNRDCRVHDIGNLYLGGNGVIPTAMACNPTITSVCYALHASDVIAKQLDSPEFSD
ncbi:pyranose 2-oxidase [Gloeopeniophorella convolvens]|nr:pyranose 2-oxidase [Gloeopeniophorella convolvens]